MNTTVDKQVRLSGHRARRLEQLAAAQGTTENALIKKALDLLFQEQEDDANVSGHLHAHSSLLKQLEAELGPQSLRPKAYTIDPAEVVSFVGTPIDPEILCRVGEEP